MRRTRKVLLIVTIVSVLIGGSAPFFANMDPTVAQETETPQLAPLNPDFVDYLENPPEPSYGYMPPPVDLSHLSEIPVLRMEALTQPPSAFDWRDTGKVTPVREQHPCGTCWIFGTIAAIESRVLVVDEVEYDFSEQNVACCTDPSWVYLTADRCGAGGWSWLATDVLAKKGTRLESCDPYDTDTINTDSCDDTCITIKRITGYRQVADSPDQIDEVKNAIYNYGPVSMAYYHTNDPLRWSGNTYYYPDCTEYANHLVTIVGWDDDIEHPEDGGSGAWIVKNSWGTDWGDDGYFYLCYGSANMQEVASYRYHDSYAGETVYYWDEAGWVTNGGYGDNSAWMASVFTCEQNGDLTHVDFWTTSNGAQYALHVYDGSFGKELASQTGSCDELGYYSIPLDTPVAMTAGRQFTVAVKMTTPGYDYPLPVEAQFIGTVEPPIQDGVCYTRHLDTDGWVDAIYFAEVGVNVCLRAKIIGFPDIGPIADIDFGDVVVGNNLDSTATIYNDGTATLTINGITRTSGSEDFSYIGPSTPFDIGAGSLQDITIQFTPTSLGSKDATFNVNSNDPDEPDVTFGVLGNGVPPPWDVNCDGYINVLDMILVGQHYGETGPPSWIPEDVNCDGVINELDMVLIGQHWTG